MSQEDSKIVWEIVKGGGKAGWWVVKKLAAKAITIIKTTAIGLGNGVTVLSKFLLLVGNVAIQLTKYMFNAVAYLLCGFAKFVQESWTNMQEELQRIDEDFKKEMEELESKGDEVNYQNLKVEKQKQVTTISQQTQDQIKEEFARLIHDTRCYAKMNPSSAPQCNGMLKKIYTYLLGLFNGARNFFFNYDEKLEVPTTEDIMNIRESLNMRMAYPFTNQNGSNSQLTNIIVALQGKGNKFIASNYLFLGKQMYNEAIDLYDFARTEYEKITRLRNFQNIQKHSNPKKLQPQIN